MPPLLDGLRIVDLAGGPRRVAGRVLAALGAEVAIVEPPGGHPRWLQPQR